MRYMLWVLIVLAPFCHANLFYDTVKLSYSIPEFGRGVSGVALSNGAASLSSNPAGLAKYGASYMNSNMDHSSLNSQFNQANIYYRSPVGIGIWKNQQSDDFVEVVSVGFSHRSRQGVDWEFI